VGPTQPPIQWVPGVLSPRVKRGRGVTLTTHPHLVPRLSMSRSYTSLPPCASMACSGTALLLLYLRLLMCKSWSSLLCNAFIPLLLPVSYIKIFSVPCFQTPQSMFFHYGEWTQSQRNTVTTVGLKRSLCVHHTCYHALWQYINEQTSSFLPFAEKHTAYILQNLCIYMRVIEIVSERKHQWGYTTVHSKAGVALTSGKINCLRPYVRKLRNYAIS
jgi:hypothetical protein